MNFKEIQELIRIFNKSGLSELKIEQESFKINIKSESGTPVYQQMPVNNTMPMYSNPTPPSTVVSSGQAPVENKAIDTKPTPEVAALSDGIEFKSPMIGTFYRSSGPDKEPFVKIGDKVNKGDVLCIIEAMKLFNEIESEMSGTIVKILLDDVSPVEYDQPLFIIEP